MFLRTIYSTKSQFFINYRMHKDSLNSQIQSQSQYSHTNSGYTLKALSKNLTFHRVRCYTRLLVISPHSKAAYIPIISTIGATQRSRSFLIGIFQRNYYNEYRQKKHIFHFFYVIEYPKYYRRKTNYLKIPHTFISKQQVID